MTWGGGNFKIKRGGLIVKKLDLQVLRYEGESKIKKSNKADGMLFALIVIYLIAVTAIIIQVL